MQDLFNVIWIIGMGLKVSDDMPTEVYELMDLYPQARQQRPGVESIPMPYNPSPVRPGRGERQMIWTL